MKQFKQNIKQLIEKNLKPRKIGNHEISQKDTLDFELSKLRSYKNFLIPQVDRDFHAFSIGLPRSGTHSLAFLFSPFYRAKHEPLRQESIINILDWINGKNSNFTMRSILAYRDKRLRLDLESSHFLYPVVEILVDLFPKAKFILTIREPISWLASEINQNYNTYHSNNSNAIFWSALQEYRYGRYSDNYIHKTLADIPGVYPISSYLSYWKDHISTVLNNVPENRLLIIDTFELKDSISDIASFLRINEENLNKSKFWSGKKKPCLNLYELIEKDKVLRQIEEHCGEYIKTQVPFLLKYLPFLS